ncbi:uncharacterized protein [Triticum aestivum]|uniref:uncharacterized protein isoform X3 n=1 Tax=Triticum aestivum TaxID=4565 RepID=UPI001D028139|nr:uncharacterized protein LOC123077087 isoform X3 [Triticum aestivum]XP_044417977.1 uncharacterized protein LOC123143196 isoform X3 [Triticum aestivum]
MVFGTRNTHGRECGLPLRPPLLCLTTAATTLRPSPPSGMLSQKPTLKLCKSIISFEFAMEREVLTILKGVNKSRRRLTRNSCCKERRHGLVCMTLSSIGWRYINVDT